jgi:hypothetical protein
MRVAWSAARDCLDLATSSDDAKPNFEWAIGLTPAQAIKHMSTIHGLPKELTPFGRCVVPRSSWRVASPRFLPKWKAPGIKWRTIIGKRLTPCNQIHSIACRCIDVLLDKFPTESWSDLRAARPFIDACLDFNKRVHEFFRSPRSTTSASDMCDCYHHIPCNEVERYWAELRSYWEAAGIYQISVPLQGGQGPGKLGNFSAPGWITVSLEHLSSIVKHFACTNYVQIGDVVGREVNGVPMGDALSNAALRLFKWSRERSGGLTEIDHVLRFKGSHVQLVHLNGCNVLVLDVSFRDDLRQFSCWDSFSSLTEDQVQAWAWERMTARYHVGSMR